MTHIEAMKQARSVISSINAGKNNALRKNNETVFWQREEWVRWALDEVLPVLNQAIAEAEKENALQALHNENEKLGLYKDAYAEQEPAARAWDEGYRFGVNDERMSEANIGIAGMGMKVEPARNNPYRTTPPQRTEQKPRGYQWFDTAVFEKELPENSNPKEWNALFTRPPQRTEQEPVIDKSAAIRIATALGWEPKREWVGLKDEDIDEWTPEIHVVIKAIEAEIKQKNGY